MAFEKDYQGRYEATKAELADQIARTTELEQELAAIKFGDAISLRERIASDITRARMCDFEPKQADDIYSWIMAAQKAQKAVNEIIQKVKGKKKGKGGRPKKVMAVELSTPTRSKKRRKYTKKSKYWAKKK